LKGEEDRAEESERLAAAMAVLPSLLEESKECQQKMIRLQRLIGTTTHDLAQYAVHLQVAKVAAEEAAEWKASLCHQLLSLTEDAFLDRGSRLRAVTEAYGLPTPSETNTHKGTNINSSSMKS
jgi:hypothetical protein